MDFRLVADRAAVFVLGGRYETWPAPDDVPVPDAFPVEALRGEDTVPRLPAPVGAGIPLGVIDTEGRLHAFWPEVRGSSPRRRGDYNALVHAALGRNGWTAPEVVLEAGAASLKWSSVQPGRPRLDGAGAIHLVVAVSDPIQMFHLVHLRLDPRTMEHRAQDIPGAGWAIYPEIAAVGDSSLALVYLGPDRSVQRQVDRNSVFFMMSADGRSTWTAPVLVSRSGTLDAFDPGMVVSDDRIDLVWRKTTGTGITIWASTSTDSGRTWAAAVAITEPGDIRPRMRPVVDEDGRLHVFYSSHNAAGIGHLVRAGEAWSATPPLLADELGSGHGHDFDIDIGRNEQIHIVALPDVREGDVDALRRRRMLHWQVPLACLLEAATR